MIPYERTEVKEVTKRNGSQRKQAVYQRPEMAKHMGISRPKAYELANTEGFPAIRIGKRIVIPYQAFIDWLQESAVHGIAV